MAHEVTGMTNSEAGARHLADMGAAIAQLSAFDATAVEQALRNAQAEVVIDELTSLPEEPSELAAAAPGDRKLRIEGGGNLHRAAMACGVGRYIQQVSGFFLEPGSGLADEAAGLAINASPRCVTRSQARWHACGQKPFARSRTPTGKTSMLAVSWRFHNPISRAPLSTSMRAVGTCLGLSRSSLPAPFRRHCACGARLAGALSLSRARDQVAPLSPYGSDIDPELLEERLFSGNLQENKKRPRGFCKHHADLLPARGGLMHDAAPRAERPCTMLRQEQTATGLLVRMGGAGAWSSLVLRGRLKRKAHGRCAGNEGHPNTLAPHLSCPSARVPVQT